MGKLYWQTNLLQTHHLPPCRTALTQINERSVSLNTEDEQTHSPPNYKAPPHHTVHLGRFSHNLCLIYFFLFYTVFFFFKCTGLTGLSYGFEIKYKMKKAKSLSVNKHTHSHTHLLATLLGTPCIGLDRLLPSKLP